MQNRLDEPELDEVTLLGFWSWVVTVVLTIGVSLLAYYFIDSPQSFLITMALYLGIKNEIQELVRGERYEKLKSKRLEEIRSSEVVDT